MYDAQSSNPETFMPSRMLMESPKTKLHFAVMINMSTTMDQSFPVRWTWRFDDFQGVLYQVMTFCIARLIVYISLLRVVDFHSSLKKGGLSVFTRHMLWGLLHVSPQGYKNCDGEHHPESEPSTQSSSRSNKGTTHRMLRDGHRCCLLNDRPFWLNSDSSLAEKNKTTGSDPHHTDHESVEQSCEGPVLLATPGTNGKALETPIQFHAAQNLRTSVCGS